MIYDEGFEVTIGDLLIFNFNHYEKPPGSSKFITNCALTLLGWAYDKKTKFRGCSIGHNVNVKEIINIERSRLIVVNKKV